MTPAEVKSAFEELRSAWESFKTFKDQVADDIKTYGEAKAETASNLDKANARIDEMEVKMQRATLGGGAAGSDQPSEAKEAFLQAIRKGLVNLEPEQKSLVKVVTGAEAKALSLGDDTTGGFLAPSEFTTEIVKGVVEFSPVREIARIRPTSNRSVMVPVRKGTFAASWVSEIGTRSETTGLKYGREEIHAHELYAEVIISEQDLEDSAFDLEAEIRMEFAEQFGVAEATAFVGGNGVGKPEGLVANTQVTTVNSGSSGVITATGMIDTFYGVKDVYARNGIWLTKRASLGAIRKIQDNTGGSNLGNFLWQPGLAPGQPNTILGAPYREAVDMPAIGAGAKSVIFGDFRRGYTIIDRVQLVVKRLTEKYAETGQIALLARKRVGGQVIVPEAFKILVLT